MTKDGEIIMIHEHTVDRTTNGTGLIRVKPLQEIRELDADKLERRSVQGRKSASV